MRNVLLITSSPRGAASLSSQVGRALAEKIAAKQSDSTVNVRDVAADPLPHLDGAYLAAVSAPNRDDLPPALKARADLADALVDELFAADTLIIASPMVNFGLSTQLKTWFDNVLRAGRTFRYTEKGPEGLVKGKTAYIVSARGGVYSQGPMQALDFQVPYLKTLLGFIGITNVEVIAIEGVAFGPAQAGDAVAAALARIAAIGTEALAA